MDRAKYEDIFFRESKKYLDALDPLLLRAEQTPAEHSCWREIHGKLHSIKGMARSLEFDPIMRLAHGMEGWCKAFQQGCVKCTPGMMDLLSDGLRILGLLLDSCGSPVNGGKEEKEVQDLISAFSNAPETFVRDAAVTEESIRPPPKAPAIEEVKVRYRLLEELLGMSREVMLAKRKMPPVSDDEAGNDCRTWADQTMSRIKELNLGLEQLRLMRVGDFITLYGRTIREIAKENGKQVKIVVTGGDIEADIALLEGLREAILHLFRNCVAHGIETADFRQKAGKAPCGLIRVSVSRKRNRLLVVMSDDGRGIDREAVLRHLADHSENPEHGDPEGLPTDEDLCRAIFDPRFSSACQTDDLAGRGIGMDVVRRSVEALGGDIGIQSTPGAGTAFTISLPLVLSVLHVVVFHVGPFFLALPTESVRTVDFNEEKQDAETRKLQAAYRLFGQAAPAVGAAPVIVLGENGPGEERIAFYVDRVIGNRPVLVLPPGRILSGQRLYSGVGVMDDGRLAMVMDVEALMDGLTHEMQHHNRSPFYGKAVNE